MNGFIGSVDSGHWSVVRGNGQRTTSNGQQATRHIKQNTESAKALREIEEKFKAVTSSAKDAIIIMDNEGCISYWNEAAEKIFGYSSDEALGKIQAERNDGTEIIIEFKKSKRTE